MDTKKLEQICSRLVRWIVNGDIGDITPIFEPKKNTPEKIEQILTLITQHTNIPTDDLAMFAREATPEIQERIFRATATMEKVEFHKKRALFKRVSGIIGKKMDNLAMPGPRLLPPRARTNFYFALADLSNLERVSSLLPEINEKDLKQYKEIRDEEIARKLRLLFRGMPELTPTEEQIGKGSTWPNDETGLVEKLVKWSEQTRLNSHLLRAWWDGHKPSERQTALLGEK